MISGAVGSFGCVYTEIAHHGVAPLVTEFATNDNSVYPERRI